MTTNEADASYVTFTVVGWGEKEGGGEVYLVRNPGSLTSISRTSELSILLRTALSI